MVFTRLPLSHMPFIQSIKMRLLFKVVSTKSALHLLTKGLPPASIRVIYRHLMFIQGEKYPCPQKYPYGEEKTSETTKEAFTTVNGITP